MTDGRRREFSAFPGFSAPEDAARIPDPQAETTFTASKLGWQELTQPNHARVLALYRELLNLRRKYSALAGGDELQGEAYAPDAGTIVMRRSAGGDAFWVIARLTSGGDVDLNEAASVLGHELRGARLDVLLDTEHAEFAADPTAIDVSTVSGATIVRFARPGAIILQT